MMEQLDLIEAQLERLEKRGAALNPASLEYVFSLEDYAPGALPPKARDMVAQHKTGPPETGEAALDFVIRLRSSLQAYRDMSIAAHPSLGMELTLSHAARQTAFDALRKAREQIFAIFGRDKGKARALLAEINRAEVELVRKTGSFHRFQTILDQAGDAFDARGGRARPFLEALEAARGGVTAALIAEDTVVVPKELPAPGRTP